MRLSRLHRRSVREYAAFVEATGALALAAFAVAFFPLRWIAAIARSGAGCRSGRETADDGVITRLQWAIGASARRMPWRTECFEKGLALHVLLRRRGVAAVLHYGLRQSEGFGLVAHVWVTVGSSVIMGGEGADTFSEVVRFPGAVSIRRPC
jgi:hypothetical protein